MADDGDGGQKAFDTPDRESPTAKQNDDMQQNRSRGGEGDEPPERDPVEIPHEGLMRGFERMREQREDDE